MGKEGAMTSKVEVATWKKKSHTLSEVAVHLDDGRVLRKEFDVGIPMTDLAAQGESLTQKFMGLAESAIGAERAKRVAEMSGKLDGVSDVGELMALVAKAMTSVTPASSAISRESVTKRTSAFDAAGAMVPSGVRCSASRNSSLWDRAGRGAAP